MFLHYSDDGANCSGLNVNGLFLLLIMRALPPFSLCLLFSPDLSEGEGWVKERNTLHQEGEKATDKAALPAVCGSSDCWELESCQAQGADLIVLVDKLFRLNKDLLKLHGGNLKECDTPLCCDKNQNGYNKVMLDFAA